MPFLKKLALWFALIVVFVALYQLNNSGGSPRVAMEPSSSTFIGVFVGIFLVLFGFFLWRARKTNNLSMAAVALLNEGRYVEALKGFEEVVKRAPRSAIAVHNLGVAQLGLWRVSEAEQTFARALKLSQLALDVRSLAIAPQGTNGSGSARLEVDYVELKVAYRLP